MTLAAAKTTGSHRDLFNATSIVVPVRRIPDGCSSISEGLGLAPEQTVWDYDWVHADNSGVQLPDKIPSGYHEAVTLLSRGGATGITLKMHDGFLDYQREHAGVSNVIEVTNVLPVADEFLYPEQSVIAQARRRSQSDTALRNAFRGKTFCSWLPASDVQSNVKAMGGNTVISAEQRWFFNSKVRIVSQAQDEQYNVAPFVVADSWQSLEPKIQELGEKARQLGIDPQKAKYWVKFDNLTGGEGVLPYEPARMDFNEVKDWIYRVRAESGMEGRDFHPLIMDIDVGCLPEVKRVVSNMCVQAVVGPENVSVAGVTLQRTRDGQYLGGALPLTDDEKRYAESAQKWAYPVLKAAQEQGYRGYAGVDVIMAEGHDDELRGYVLEMNGRLCSSTPLLSTAHWVGDRAGVPDVVAHDFTVDLPNLQDFGAFRRLFNSLLYKGAESDHAGLIPVLMEPDTQGRIKGAKMIAVAPDEAALRGLDQRYQGVVSRLGR